MVKTKLLLCLGFVPLLTACVYYEEFRQRKADADLRQEVAELLKQYRLCVQRYENEPAKSRELCAPYVDALHRLNVRQLDHPIR